MKVSMCGFSCVQSCVGVVAVDVKNMSSAELCIRVRVVCIAGAVDSKMLKSSGDRGEPCGSP